MCPVPGVDLFPALATFLWVSGGRAARSRLPLAIDGAIMDKINGRSYGAHCAQTKMTSPTVE
jgi:hypothetical protein